MDIRADKYRSVQVVALLQQLITYGGFYDDNLEFLRLQNIQIVATMAPVTNSGRQQISSRLTSIMRAAHITYPERDELKLICKTMLSRVLDGLNKEDSAWKSAKRSVDSLANTMIDVYEGRAHQYCLLRITCESIRVEIIYIIIMRCTLLCGEKRPMKDY